LPLWLRPYEVLVTSNRTALIELIPDSLSIHTIKAKSPPGASLRDHFIARHGQVYRPTLTCPTGTLQCSYYHQLEDNCADCTAMYLSVSALSTCLYLHCLPICICTVYLPVSALSTCLYLHCLPVCICIVYLSVSALSTCLCLHCIAVCICTVYLSVFQVAESAIALAISGLPAITIAVIFSQTESPQSLDYRILLHSFGH